MVDHSALNRTFSALGDPTRRALLVQLATGSSTVSDLARPFPISLQAVIKHLDQLADAGLITREKTGRTVACTLVPEPMEQAARWITDQHDVWEARFGRLDAYLRRLQEGKRHD